MKLTFRSGPESSPGVALATALEALVTTVSPPGNRMPEGALRCLGLRLLGFDDPAWQAALAWCRGAPGLGRADADRAARFLRPRDGARHLLGQLLLRSALARRGAPPLPDTWPLNAWGKPEGIAWGTHFNLSHSGEEIWLALHPAAPLGIDTEAGIPALEDLRGQVHPDEWLALRNEGGAEARRRLWMRKEAVVKAAGCGLSMDLTAFQVAVDARMTGWLLQAPSTCPGPWTCLDLDTGLGRRVSLAMLGTAETVAVHCATVIHDGSVELSGKT